MKTQELLTWSAFKERLQANHELELNFQYANDQRVDTSYHITEIKLAPITSVDCGGVLNRWTEVIVQLWEPLEKQTERAMSVGKALSIIGLVERTISLDDDAIVKIEFGNSAYDTRQMYPGEFSIEGNQLVVDLTPDSVQCKATGRKENSGEVTSANASACCGSNTVCC